MAQAGLNNAGVMCCQAPLCKLEKRRDHREHPVPVAGLPGLSLSEQKAPLQFHRQIPLACSSLRLNKARYTVPISSMTSQQEVSRSAATTQVASRPQVVVTREQGKNGKLVKALASHGIECLELPLIEHREGPDVHLLPQVLKEEMWDWIVVTSPEAATVFLEGWRAADRPKVHLAVVGAGTGEILEDAPEANELRPEFTPSKATAKVLAAEIPEPKPGSRVLYPASGKAGTDLQEGLTARGFVVSRLNTYSTETVRTLDPDALAAAASVPVATFASPTAVKAWVERVCQGDVKRWGGAAACIGNTSAVAARNAGLERIYFPDSPGIEGWVDSVLQALSASTG